MRARAWRQPPAGGRQAGGCGARRAGGDGGCYAGLDGGGEGGSGGATAGWARLWGQRKRGGRETRTTAVRGAA